MSESRFAKEIVPPKIALLEWTPAGNRDEPDERARLRSSARAFSNVPRGTTGQNERRCVAALVLRLCPFLRSWEQARPSQRGCLPPPRPFFGPGGRLMHCRAVFGFP